MADNDITKFNHYPIYIYPYIYQHMCLYMCCYFFSMMLKEHYTRLQAITVVLTKAKSILKYFSSYNNNTDNVNITKKIITTLIITTITN